jgi:predicted esterase
MILLLGTSVVPGRWDIIDYFSRGELTADSSSNMFIRAMPGEPDVRNIDAAMQHVLRSYAVDPQKIALLGMSDGGSYTSFLGRNNLDVFDRLVALSPGLPFHGAGPANPKTRAFVLGGIAEVGFLQGALTAGDAMEKAGHQVDRALLLRGHEQRRQDYDLAFTWLKKSWTSGSTTLPSRVVTADSVAELTVEQVQKLTTLWTALMKAPDSIRSAGRSTNQAQIVVPVGGTQMVLPMFDIPALAARYPSVAADLEAAGLTAKDAERFTIAALSAIATRQAKQTAGTVPVGSALEKNVEFVNEQLDAFKALTATGMWVAQ